MSEDHTIFPVKTHIKYTSKIDKAGYEALYATSIDDNEAFWRIQGQRLDWIEPYSIVKNVDFKDNARIKWYEDGVLNVSANCIDRHLEKNASKLAFIYEGDHPDVGESITYQELHDRVCKLANGLKERGVKKGDRVTIYMPMVPEAAYAMLACARIGAVHSVVFGGFSPSALKDRILDCESDYVITADEGLRGGKKIPLKANVDEALKDCPNVRSVVVLRRTGNEINWVEGRDIWYKDLCESQKASCEPEPMNAEDPLFILYTSGSTGKPKGVVHTTGGYLVYMSLTHEYVFDCHDGDTYWCTADVGWITGHSYVVYGPLANGSTSLIFEGVPNYPDVSRFWNIIDKHHVTIFYTAPTAIRALLAHGDAPVTRTSRQSLRILGTVGEPINEEAWLWYHNVVGNERCPIVDTWWQTETGGILITPLPGVTDLKPGYATKPFFGVQPALVDNDGNIIKDTIAEGNLVMTDSWPGQARTLYKDHDRFVQTYFTTFPGKYFTGDGAKRDADGDYRITGRVDDVINVSGHRFGTAEIEEALNGHDSVAESAVVGYPHDIKGQAIYAYVTLNEGVTPSEAIYSDLIQQVRDEIGAIAKPDAIQFASALPKTRSGKIMRRILRKIAANEADQLGDTSTLADPSVVEDLIKGHESVVNKQAA